MRKLVTGNSNRIMKTKSSIIIGIFLTLISCQSVDNKTYQQIDSLFDYCFQNKMFNGVVLVQQRQEIIYHKGFGKADFENDIDNSKDSKFRIGSLTKPITSMAIFNLIKEGEIAMNGQVSDYLNSSDSSSIGHITIYQLLTHTSGIKDFITLGNREEYENRINSKNDIIELIQNLPLLYEPGSQYKYSSSNHFLLGAILESVTKEKYIDVLQKNVFSKANMQNTGIGDRYFASQISKGYYKELTGFELADTVSLTYPFSAGALYSSAEDLSLLIDLINIESKSSEFGMHWINDSIRPFGLGVLSVDTLVDGSRKNLFVHNGGIYGYSSRMVWVKEDDIKIIFLTNDYNRYLNELTEKVLAILYQKDYSFPKKHLSDLLLDKYHGNKNFPSIELTDSELNHCQVSEKELTMFGYSFVKTKDFENAETIFRLAINIFPESDNVQLCLGNIYDQQNNLDSAKHYYTKTLIMNPENKDARMLLNRLETK